VKRAGAKRYVRRAEPVEALRWTGDNIEEVMAFMEPHRPQYMAGFSNADDLIGTPGRVANKGDYIVRRLDGTAREILALPPEQFDARYRTQTVSESPGDSGEGDQRVVFEFHPECLEGENVREFHPEIVGAAMGALRTMLDPEKDARAHRDADILASCAVSEALKALVAVADLTQPVPGSSGGVEEAVAVFERKLREAEDEGQDFTVTASYLREVVLPELRRLEGTR
jgi:hypothetical protein